MPNSNQHARALTAIEGVQQIPRWLRLLLVAAGVLFLLIGLVMLLIPILPQVWAFVLAAICFSLASQAIWRWLEVRLRRWPRVHERAVEWRSRLFARLSR